MLHAAELLASAGVFQSVVRIGLFVLIVVVLGGCSLGSLPGTGPVNVTGSWRLQSGSVQGAPIALVADAPITLRVEGTEIGGSASCNTYGGTLLVEGDSVQLTDIMQTLMGCDDDRGAAEAAYMQALAAVRTAQRSGVTLVLAGDGVELRYIDAAAEGG